MSAVPDQTTKETSWTSVPFGQIATLINGRAYKRSELLAEGTPVLRIQNLNGGDRWYYSNLQLPPDKYCERDDLLFAWSASFGPYIWDGDKSIYHYHIWKVIPGPRLDKRFAFRLLGFLTQSVKDAAHGVAMLHITKGKMEAWEVSIPPLAEQKRITGILDAADALRAKRRESLAQLDTLLQSTFLDMFGDPVINPMRWEVRELGKVASFYAGSTLPAGRDFVGQEGGFLYLKVGDLNHPLNSEDVVRSNIWGEEAKNGITAPIDAVVIPKRGGAIGTNKKRLLSRKAVLDPNLMAISGSESLDHVYLYRWFHTFDLMSITSGSTVPQLNKRDLAPLRIQLPPTDLQHRFATIIGSIAQHRASQRAHLDELDTLFASLQTRAFRGDL